MLIQFIDLNILVQLLNCKKLVDTWYILRQFILKLILKYFYNLINKINSITYVNK